MTTITQKDPAEAFAVEFDFTALLASITTTSCTATMSNGEAATAGEILDGTAQIVGTKVRQRVDSGLVGRDYEIRCTASDGIETYVLVAILPVRKAR